MSNDYSGTAILLALIGLLGTVALVAVAYSSIEVFSRGGVASGLAHLVSLGAPCLILIAAAGVGRAVLDMALIATHPPAAPLTPWPSGRVEVYTGFEITAAGDAFMVAGRSFPTVAEARRHIDSRNSNSGLSGFAAR